MKNMPPLDIDMPANNSLASLSAFSKELFELPEKNELRIGCGHLKFVTPSTLVFLSKACAQRRRRYENETLVYRGLNLLDYANNLGFSQSLNLKANPYKQGAFGGPTYIPISSLRREKLEQVAAENAFDFGDAISLRCDNIAKVVSQGRSDALHSALSRSFCELFRNTFEHGEVDQVGFCAQHWPRLNEVEICISDRGIGLKESLNQSKYTKPEDDREAAYFSLMPGVSSKAWRHKKKKAHQKTPWDNAGYGLFFAHQLFGNMGHFMIASGNKALFMNTDRLTEHDCYVEGTLVSLRISLADEAMIEGTLKDITNLAAKVKERLGVKSLNFNSVEGFLRANSI